MLGNSWGILSILSGLFVTLAGFSSITDAIQRRSIAQKDAEELIGLRLSLRLALSAAVLCVLPFILSLIFDLDPALIWDSSAMAFMGVIIRELIVNMAEFIKGKTPTSPGLFLFGVAGYSFATFLLFMSVVSNALSSLFRLSTERVYLLCILWTLIFIAVHFIHYTHKDFPQMDRIHSSTSLRGHHLKIRRVRKVGQDGVVRLVKLDKPPVGSHGTIQQQTEQTIQKETDKHTKQ